MRRARGRKPHHALLVTAAPDHVPRQPLEQLAVGGGFVVFVGDDEREVPRVRRVPDGCEPESLPPACLASTMGEAMEPR